LMPTRYQESVPIDLPTYCVVYAVPTAKRGLNPAHVNEGMKSIAPSPPLDVARIDIPKAMKKNSRFSIIVLQIHNPSLIRFGRLSIWSVICTSSKTRFLSIAKLPRLLLSLLCTLPVTFILKERSFVMPPLWIVGV
jgi:hypothetical protein